MKRRHQVWRPAALLVLPILAVSALRAQEGELDKSPPKAITPGEIIQRFTAKEKEWKQVREQYTFRQEVKVNTLRDGQVVGEYHQVADISYLQGKRVKTIAFAPQPSITLSPQDVEDVETRSSFTIGTDELRAYNLVYVGQQKEDLLHCYVFDVAPKQIEKGKRYFQGRLWIDDQDFQIVKNTGKSAPDIRIVKKKRVEENLFPQFTTWRQQIDGKYWFPTFSSSDDTLHFQNEDVHLKQVLKFTDYKWAGAAAPAKEKPSQP